MSLGICRPLSILFLLASILSIVACPTICPPTSQKQVTVYKGNTSGPTFVLNGHDVFIHLAFQNEATIRADWLEAEFSFQFGSDSNALVAYVLDTNGGGATYPIKPGYQNNYDFSISDADNPRLDGRSFSNLELLRLVRLRFYNYQEDAFRPIDEIEYSMTLWQR